MLIRSDVLSITVYNALARKLRFLPKEVLRELHHVASFNVMNSQMKESLHLIEPPSRSFRVNHIKTLDPHMLTRLGQSAKLEVQLGAARIIQRSVMRWWNKCKYAKLIQKRIQEAAAMRSAADEHNDADDELSQYSKGSKDSKK